MNLQPMMLASSGARLRVFCRFCDGSTPDNEATADLDAKPGTYYCLSCAAFLRANPGINYFAGDQP